MKIQIAMHRDPTILLHEQINLSAVCKSQRVQPNLYVDFLADRNHQNQSNNP